MPPWKQIYATFDPWVHGWYENRIFTCDVILAYLQPDPFKRNQWNGFRLIQAHVGKLTQLGGADRSREGKLSLLGEEQIYELESITYQQKYKPHSCQTPKSDWRPQWANYYCCCLLLVAIAYFYCQLLPPIATAYCLLLPAAIAFAYCY